MHTSLSRTSQWPHLTAWGLESIVFHRPRRRKKKKKWNRNGFDPNKQTTLSTVKFYLLIRFLGSSEIAYLFISQTFIEYIRCIEPWTGTVTIFLADTTVEKLFKWLNALQNLRFSSPFRSWVLTSQISSSCSWFQLCLSVISFRAFSMPSGGVMARNRNNLE